MTHLQSATHSLRALPALDWEGNLGGLRGVKIMKTSMGLALVLAMGLSVPAPAVIAAPEPAAMIAAKAAKGRLAVRVTGTGTYTVRGKHLRKTASVSKTFRLKTGKYRIAAPKAVITRKKVRVRKGHTVRVSISFAPTNPQPTPTPTPPPVSESTITRISTSAAGEQASSGSQTAAWSPDGTRVAFVSAADNLVPQDTNASVDVFVKTLATGVIERISVSTAGAQGVGESTQPVWSPDSTRIAFTSRADTLVNGDTNNVADVFIKELATGVLYRASTRHGGGQADGVSAEPAWSPNGASLAFASAAANLVSQDNNGAVDVFVKDLALGKVQRVSTDTDQKEGNKNSRSPAWSADGTRISFISEATNLIGGDTNGLADLFIKTLSNQTTSRVNGTEGETRGGAAKSSAWAPVGNSLAFMSEATNVVPADGNVVQDLFVIDLTAFVVRRISTDASDNQANGRTTTFAWSPDGTRVAFSSEASNLVLGDTNGREDVFVRNLSSGAVTRVSLGLDGSQGNHLSRGPSWSADGTRVAFESWASNLVPGDTNAAPDVFVAKVG